MSAPGPTATARPGTSRGGPSRSVIAVVVAVVAVVAVLVAVVVGRAMSASPQPTPSAAPSATASAQEQPGKAVPAGATGFGGPLVVNPGAPANVPTLKVFEDPQCPICRQFEAAYGPTIAAMVKAGQVKHVVHTMSFLDLNLRNDSSKRAANAAFCAADQGSFPEYMQAVYAGQPATEGQGFTDEQLTGFATAVGISGTALDTWKACLAAGTYVAHVAALEANAEQAGVTSTPTVMLNGQKVTNVTPDGLLAAVKAATR
ncbi:MAG: DsbA family protein [Dermatophilaceae bacterium]